MSKARKSNAEKRNAKFSLEPLEPRIVLAAPQFVSIQPNVGDVLQPFDILNSSPRELTIRFNQDVSGSAASLNGVQVLRNGVEVDGVNRELGLLGNTVVLRFADALPDDVYSVRVTPELQNLLGESFDPAAPVNQTLPLSFELDLGTKVAAVVPQPITRNGQTISHALDQIEIYFDDDELSPALAEDVNFYRLILTEDSVTNTDDSFFLPTSAVYTPAEAKVVLTFADNLHNLADGAGTFRLRVGTDEVNPSSVPLQTTQPATEPGDSFDTAYDLATLDGTSKIVSETIEVSSVFPLNFPGSGLEPGQSSGDRTDIFPGYEPVVYNFNSTYGLGGTNLITEPQKQRVREAFEVFANYTGAIVLEHDSEGLTIATGDPELGDDDVLVIDNSNNWNDEFLAADRQGAPSYFSEIFHRVSRLFIFEDPDTGEFFIRHSERQNGRDLSSGDVRFIENDLERIFPRNDIVVDMQRSFRPENNDIDLYQFEIASDSAGLFSAEILAERSDDILDSMLRVYRQVGSSYELVAQNDDYFSEDSFLQLRLDPGTYFIGVSSTGNDQYDPDVVNSGFGGTSAGDYELRIDFRADDANAITDISGVALDGDSDGTPGGVFNFWFRAAAPEGSDLRQNEVQVFDITGATDGTFALRFNGVGTDQIPYDAGPTEVQNALEGLAAIQPGDVIVTGNALPDGPISVEFTGNYAFTDVSQLVLRVANLTGGVPTISTTTNGNYAAKFVYVDKLDTTPDDLPNAGTLANPYNVIHTALNLDINGLPLATPSNNGAMPGDVVRILGNGDSPENSVPYEIGIAGFNNQPLADGAKLDIPNDITVMVDAGAVFKMRRSAILVGSTSVGVDHSPSFVSSAGHAGSSNSFHIGQ